MVKHLFHEIYNKIKKLNHMISAIIFPILLIGFVIQLIYLSTRLSIKQKYHKQALFFLSGITLGLIYDTLILSIGRYVGFGAFLFNLNYGRYAIHSIFTPLLMVVVERLEHSWEEKNNIIKESPDIQNSKKEQIIKFLKSRSLFGYLIFGLWIFSIFYSIFHDLIHLEMEERTIDGVVYYRHLSEGTGPPLIPILTIIIILVISVYWCIKSHRGYWLILVGSGVMFFAAAVPSSIVGPVAGSIGELILNYSIVGTSFQLLKDSPKPE
jgi:hypothetical protein